jgi:hypothetical protein
MRKNRLYLMCHFDLLKHHIDEFGKTLYGTNNDIFVIPENGDCQQ